MCLDLDGALTAANARRFERVVVDALAGDAPPPYLAVDLVRLTLVDEEGLGALVRASDLAQAAGTSLVLREPRRSVERLLRIAGLGDLVRSDPSLRPLQPPGRPQARVAIRR